MGSHRTPAGTSPQNDPLPATLPCPHENPKTASVKQQVEKTPQPCFPGRGAGCPPCEAGVCGEWRVSIFPWERTEGEGPARGRATSGQSLAPPAGARIKLGQLPASQPCDPNCLPRASPAARAATASSPHRPPCVRESVCRRARASRGDAEGGRRAERSRKTPP